MATILIVDDHLEAIRPLALLMRHMGHTGVCVDSGEKALMFLRDGNADLVILDAMMPVTRPMRSSMAQMIIG